METSLNENTYELLKHDIMSFKLIAGEAVSAAKIAERYKVSRTPAREAIVKLEKEGLVEIIPQSRTLISKIDLRRAEQEWFVRSSLEVDMVPLFIRNCTDAGIQRLKDNYEQQKKAHTPIDTEDYFRLDNEFHSIIYDIAGEQLSNDIIATHMTHYNRIRFLTDLSSAIRDKTLHEHEQIIEAAEDRDIEWMQAVLKKHIRRIHAEQNEIVEKYPDYFA